MVARMECWAGGAPLLHGLHVTFLAEDSDGKAPVFDDKGRSLAKRQYAFTHRGLVGSGIWLFSPHPEMVTAEGIEKALAVHLATGLPVVAAGSASLLAALVVPPTVRHVLIAADHGPAGERAASALAQRLSSSGQQARIAFPPNTLDWDEVLIANEAANVDR